jgi:hypothetical protein
LACPKIDAQVCEIYSNEAEANAGVRVSRVEKVVDVSILNKFDVAIFILLIVGSFIHLKVNKSS